MPHLVYCQHYWKIGGDDLSIPALCSIGGRFVWTALIVAAFFITFPTLQSDANNDIMESTDGGGPCSPYSHPPLAPFLVATAGIATGRGDGGV